MRPDLDTRADQRSVEQGRIPDLGCHGVIDALVVAALVDVGTVGIAEGDADGDAGAGLGGEQANQLGVLGEEQAAVDEDADVVFGVLEQLAPDPAGDRSAVRIGGVDLGVDGRDVGEVGPQVVLVQAEQVGDAPAMTCVRDAAAEPALNGLGVDAEGLRDVHVTQARANEGSA